MRFQRASCLLTVGAATLVAAALVTMPTVAEAHYVRINWSYKGSSTCSSSRITDPVTAVYQGSGATSARAIRDVQAHTGWRNDDRDVFLGAEIFHRFRTGHGDNCDKQDGERANKAGPFRNRYHLRFSQSSHISAEGQWFTFMTPHKEDWVQTPGCLPGSHAVEPGHQDENYQNNKYYASRYYSGFDHGRDELVNKVTSNQSGHGRHTLRARFWRNTHSVKQCNGWYSGASGTVFVISLGRYG